MAIKGHLSVELERFAMRKAEDRRRRFMAMLRVAEAETDRSGTVSVESLSVEIDEIIRR